jgi:leucyl-tRNA synthetase
MHLIYTRFWTKFMRDIGLGSFDEPVKRLLTQGMVTNRVEGTDEWKAMSKSLGNGVDPDEMIEVFGADAARLFVLFAAPVENELRWSESGIEGAVRFLRRVYTMLWYWQERVTNRDRSDQGTQGDFSDEARALRRKTHQTIVRVTSDFEKLDLNTNVAALMELLNALGEFRPISPVGKAGALKFTSPETASGADVFVIGEALDALVLMLTPFSPHIAEEMWEALGHDGGLLRSGFWPQADPELARSDELEIPIQVNGKLRSRVVASREVTEDQLRTAALNDEKIRGLIEGREVVKVIVVPQRLVNIVVK